MLSDFVYTDSQRQTLLKPLPQRNLSLPLSYRLIFGTGSAMRSVLLKQSNGAKGLGGGGGCSEHRGSMKEQEETGRKKGSRKAAEMQAGNERCEFLQLYNFELITLTSSCWVTNPFVLYK